MKKKERKGKDRKGELIRKEGGWRRRKVQVQTAYEVSRRGSRWEEGDGK